MSDNWTVLAVLDWTAGYFTEHNLLQPRLNAELLIGEVLGLSRLELYLQFDRPLGDSERAALRSMVKKRAQGHPLAYICGYQDFMGQKIQLDSRVLIPRVETEQLVELCWQRLGAAPPESFLEIGVGSGCISRLLLEQWPQAVGVGVDLSAAALQVAAQNLAPVASQIELRCGDLYAPLVAGEQFNLIISNPPYIPADRWEKLPADVQCEPRLALLSGPDGLDLIRPLLAGALVWLKPGGVLALEMDESHASLALELAQNAGLVAAEVLPDLAQRPRFLWAKAPRVS